MKQRTSFTAICHFTALRISAVVTPRSLQIIENSMTEFETYPSRGANSFSIESKDLAIPARFWVAYLLSTFGVCSERPNLMARFQSRSFRNNLQSTNVGRCVAKSLETGVIY